MLPTPVVMTQLERVVPLKPPVYLRPLHHPAMFICDDGRGG
jgi:hypothetical protein